MKRIGILGGSSDQATKEYYARLNREVNRRLGGWNTAEIILTSMNFAFSEECVRNGLWDEMGAYLADRSRALELGGADLFVCVSNTLHRVADRFCPAVAIPFLHIADPTARAIQAAGLTHVALLGTKPVMAENYMKDRYESQFGINITVPDEKDQDYVDSTIFLELCQGVFTEATRREYVRIIRQLQERGAQGVILGCTEIPLLLGSAELPDIAVFDTLELHVNAIVDAALA
jgi:aspartate racemase